MQTPHLASHLLATAVRGLRSDWRAQHGRPLWRNQLVSWRPWRVAVGVTTPKLTYYVVILSRAAAVVLAVLGPDFPGVLVSDYLLRRQALLRTAILLKACHGPEPDETAITRVNTLRAGAPPADPRG